jgi:hypothetical protein
VGKVTETGFVSKEQEEFLRLNQPELYNYVLNKFGSYGGNRKPVVKPQRRTVTKRRIP